MLYEEMISMFYGMTYNKFREEIVKDFKNISKSFENEYDALDFSNKSWLEENEDQGEYNRLLAVVDSTDTNKVAFFQFTRYNVCKRFIENQNEIIWSNDENKIWNGNAKMM